MENTTQPEVKVPIKNRGGLTDILTKGDIIKILNKYLSILQKYLKYLKCTHHLKNSNLSCQITQLTYC